MEARPTQYAVRDGVHIGFQVWGLDASPETVDVLEFNNGLMISIDETVDEPNWLRYTERVGAFSRLIRFDAGGLGLSDPLPTGLAPSIEGWAKDALAVMDAAGCDRAIVLATTGGTMAALWLAAHHPERVAGLILVNGTARVVAADDYPFGVPEELTTDMAVSIEVPLVDPDVPQDVAIFAPSLAHRVGFKEWWGRAARRGASPATAVAFNLVTFTSDVRGCLPDIACPTLLMSRTEGFIDLVEHGRYLSERIQGARFVTFVGPDLLAWAGEFDSIVDEMELFVTGERSVHAAERLLATVLFTDIVDSTVRAATAGDRQWRAVLDEFDVNVGRLLARHDGVLVKNTGDGILARFLTPAQGVRCAVAMVSTASSSGLELRAGLHAGEVELRGDDIGGLAVHIAS
ncbi:MAG TPA: adenylate/guanylate cyclase domain-containing protein, partial [Acidimicrobiales bacterium]|nr:adenylate/guanylate cyclase domain-containing protein [Acidimicrobiales bacterium]